MTTQTDTARDQAQAQLNHIVELMEWLEHANECDGDEDCDRTGGSDADAMHDLGMSNDDYHDVDAATEAIHENALSVMVRSEWFSVGLHRNEIRIAEFEILLCTGGPAVKLMGELDEHGQPTRAWLEYQDWGTPWTKYIQTAYAGPEGDEHNGFTACLNYASTFYFGE